MTSLSIIIVSYNTKDLLRDCLKSILKALPHKGDLEIIIVDNASKDESVAMIEADFPQVRLIKNSKNLGFAAANNLGAKKATGSYLLFLNSDTKLSPYALVKPLKFIKTHPDVGAITVKLILPDGSLDKDNHRGFPTPWTALTHFSGLSRLFPASPLLNNYYQSYRNLNAIHTLDVAAGSFLMMPMSLFNKIGGWDESYFFYGEDIDLCFRIHQAGKKIIYYPKVTVLHYKGASSGLRKESKKIAKPPKETRVKVARASIQAMEIFYKKFYRDKYPGIITWLVLTGIKFKGYFRVLKHQLS